MTPLLLSSSKGAIDASICLINLRADLLAVDKNGRGVVQFLLLSGAGAARDTVPHLIKAGKLGAMYDIQDRWGCSSLHIAARLGLRVAFAIGLSQNCNILLQDIERSTPLHSAARYARLNICQQALQTEQGKRAMFVTDNKGRLPIHVAAQYGHNAIVECLLSSGSMNSRCFDGNTPLHYAAISGNPATCALLLDIDPRALNELNSRGLTPLHVASMNDNAQVTSYLLSVGARILPDNNGHYFTTYAFQPNKCNLVKVILSHNRFPEIIKTLREADHCPVEKIIKNNPTVMPFLMDRYMNTINNDKEDDFKVNFDYTLLQEKMTQKQKPLHPLRLLKMLVDRGQEELITHPLTQAFLKTKWRIYGWWVQTIITVYHLLICISVTWLSINQTTSLTYYKGRSVIECAASFTKKRQRVRGYYILVILVSVLNGSYFISKVHQIFLEKRLYFRDKANVLLMIFQILVLIETTMIFLEWQSPHRAVLSVFVMFISWFNLLMQLSRLPVFGIFVIMFLEVAKTMIKSATVLSTMFIGFAFMFHKLLTLPDREEFFSAPYKERKKLSFCFVGFEHLNYSTILSEDEILKELPLRVYSNLGWSFFQTLMMMVGEYGHTEVVIGPYLDDQASSIYLPELTFPTFIAFIFMIPVAMMNLLIGLAVGDIDRVQRSATHQLISQQVHWLESIEDRCSNWMYKRIYKANRVETCSVPYKKPIYDLEEEKTDITELNSKVDRIVYLLQTQSTKMLQINQQLGIPDEQTEVDEGVYDSNDSYFTNWSRVKPRYTIAGM